MRPDVGPILPVFVVNRYAGLQARKLQELSAAERHEFVRRNVATVREHLPAEVAYVNHVLLGGPVGAGVREAFVVKAHGSDLEYSTRGNAELCRGGATRSATPRLIAA